MIPFLVKALVISVLPKIANEVHINYKERKERRLKRLTSKGKGNGKNRSKR